MRFSVSMITKWLLYISSIYVLYLGATQQLGFYIHPRYVVFTMVMAVCSTSLILIGAISEEKQKEDAHTDPHSKLIAVPLLLIVAAAIMLPARSLTSATVSQRSTDRGSIVATSETEAISSLFAGSSRGLGVSDWSRLIKANTDPDYYVNKPAKVSGFIYDGGFGDNTVLLARFVLTCCAVDAQPVGVPVQLSDWPSQYEEDQWLEVEGEFRIQDTQDGPQPVLVPDEVMSIEVPDNPYAY